MVYRIRHTTTYRYSEAALISYNHARLTPRVTPRQQVLGARIVVDPTPDALTAQHDYFGNAMTFFAIHQPHHQLTVEAELVVGMSAWDRLPSLSLPVASVEAEATGGMASAQGRPETAASWEQVAARVRRHEDDATLRAYEFCFDSPHVTASGGIAQYARESFPPNREVIEAVTGLNRRIHHDLVYDPAVTTISTPAGEVLRERRGVCQDYAHLMIACLRSMGLPARYVSGYLRPRADVVGYQASHAWVSVFCLDAGWVDFDPTNDILPSDGHVTLAWGRDFGDVTPVKGVMLGGGEHELEVAVEFTVDTES